MRQIAEFVAVLSCSLFTGASVYVNLVEHPARMERGVELALTEFPPSYRRGTVMQATLAAVGLLAAVAAWLAGATIWWLVAGFCSAQSFRSLLSLSFPPTRDCSARHWIGGRQNQSAYSDAGIRCTP